MVLLGVVTSALSLVALMRALSAMSKTVRIERAREAVEDELGRLVKGRPPTGIYVGLRAGHVAGPGAVPAIQGLPETWRAPLAQVVEKALFAREPTIEETPLGDATLVLAAQWVGNDYAWTGYSVLPSAFLRPWHWIVFALAMATGLLVTTTVWGVFSFRRSTSSLHATLVALGKDLTTPVPQPRIAELTGIADGIRRMAADLLASREAIDRQERLAALGRVAAGVAHEVRNPLASIKLRLDLTAATAELPDATRKAVEAASLEIARLDRLVGDLLLVAGKKMGPRRTVELGQLLRERAEALSPWADKHQVTVHTSGQAAAEIDPEAIARAIDNLLRNAVEASPAGGTVEARVTASGSAVEIAVEDRGRGVEPARAAELFEPFFTTKADGTGLGLAISRAIARGHGGDVQYTRQGEVTRFVVSLPRAAQRDQVAA